jgi:hypothetical protein
MHNFLTPLLFLSILFFVETVTSEDGSEEERSDWHPSHIAVGPASMIGGAAAPVLCGLRYTWWPFEHASGQGAIGILFTPFVSAFGIITGTVRGVSMIVTGIGDTVTGGAYQLSFPYWESPGSIAQWCACIHSRRCTEELEKTKDLTLKIQTQKDHYKARYCFALR